MLRELELQQHVLTIYSEERQPSDTPTEGTADNTDFDPCEFEDDSSSQSNSFLYHMFQKYLYPREIKWYEMTPSLLTLTALILTSTGSWSCSFFEGAAISFTGNSYGLWTIENYYGRCEPWDTAFFAYTYDAYLTASRAFSMMSMLIGLGLFTTMVQAMEFHIVSWLVGLIFMILLLVSLSTTSLFNIWICFFFFSYILMILIVRAAFIHPVHREITQRRNKVIAWFCFFCGVFNLLTLIALRSDYCTCENLTTAHCRDPDAPCDGVCALGPAGYLVVVASAVWFLTAYAVVKWGVQPILLFEHRHVPSIDGYYPRVSITTRFIKTMQMLSPRGGGQTHGKAWNTKASASQQDTSEDKSCVTDVTDITECHTDVAVDPLPDSTTGQIEDDEESDKRRVWKKVCCDYRITPRSGKEMFGFWAFRFLLGCIIVMYFFILTVLMGSRFENTKAGRAPDTSSAFLTDTVCAWDPLHPARAFQTIPTKKDAEGKNLEVAHCGECGYCSNPKDIQIYVYTRETIANTVKECKFQAMVGDMVSLTQCLVGKTGLSEECALCWAEDMVNTANKCLITCIKTLFTGFMANNNVPGAGDSGWLNQCLFCDEKMSGPAFVKCSGVARRRLGIRSEIDRNPHEQCNKSDVDWLTVDWEDVFQIPA